MDNLSKVMKSHVDAPQHSVEQRNRRLTELLSSIALSDRRAFQQLYELTSANLFGVILRILKRDEWAEDCLQEAYVRVWRSAESYRPHLASPMTWLMAIARNQALDLLRRRRREVRESEVDLLSLEPDGDPLLQDQLQLSEEAKMLDRCLAQLRPQQRQLIALAYFKGLTHEELAECTQTPLGTVKTWIRRGLAQLKRCLES